MSEPMISSGNTKPLWRRGWFLALLAAGLLGLGLFVLFGVLAIIAFPMKYQGTSMVPALRDGDRLMIRRRVADPKRGDVVVFYYPKDTTKSFVKRIIALPGETIRIDHSGSVHINNTEIQEPYLSPDLNRHPRSLDPITLAPNQYFMMGDARDSSNDSRLFGPVERKLIYGKVMWRYWPLGR